MKPLSLFVFMLITLVPFPLCAEAKVKVVTSVSDLKALVELVGKDFVEVQSIAKGTQDPHFLDAKPSYMTKLTDAKLLVCIGLGLEDAWLLNVIKGARNPKLNVGGEGYLAVGPKLNPGEIPTGSEVSRANGDVHPEGNPHVTVDPVRMGEAAVLVAAKLSDLDPAHKDAYTANGAQVKKMFDEKTEEWKKRVAKTGITRVVTYHRTLDYFLQRMNLELAAVLEPKPGIAPSVAHLSKVVETMKTKKANVVLIENYFDPTVGNKLKELNPKVQVAIVPVSVDGDTKIKTLTDLYENLVKTLEGMK